MSSTLNKTTGRSDVTQTTIRISCICLDQIRAKAATSAHIYLHDRHERSLCASILPRYNTPQSFWQVWCFENGWSTNICHKASFYHACHRKNDHKRLIIEMSESEQANLLHLVWPFSTYSIYALRCAKGARDKLPPYHDLSGLCYDLQQLGPWYLPHAFFINLQLR